MQITTQEPNTTQNRPKKTIDSPKKRELKEVKETAAEKRAYEKAIKELENGETISHEELKRRLGYSANSRRDVYK